MKVEYIKGTKLSFPDLWNHFGMHKDNGGRWLTTNNTQVYVVEYLDNYRSPSRAWPNSYAVAMLSQKFAKLVIINEPDLAIKLNIGKEI